jgi:hypothetical protein
MSGSKRYVLDANVFVEPANRFYSFKLCPGYWRALIVQHEKSLVCSIDRVLDELTKKRDPLSKWATDTVPGTFFKKTQDRAVFQAFQAMVTWVNSAPQFMPAAKTEFAAAADGWVVAFARVNHLIVVTHEEYAPDAKKMVPIPNVCLEFDVQYVNTFEMLKDLGVRFVLSTKRQRPR